MKRFVKGQKQNIELRKNKYMYVEIISVESVKMLIFLLTDRLVIILMKLS